MATSPELRAHILRLFHVEHWRVGTIARQLGVHHSSVERVLGESGVARERQRERRPSLLDDYLPFIHETLERFPTLTARRLYEMARARGYRGGADHFRHRVAQLRPRRRAEAYLRLRTLAGEQAQVDWALCRAERQGGGTARLCAYCVGIVCLLPEPERRANMEPVVERLWVLRDEPVGPLTPYLDAFASHLNTQGYKRHLLGRQIRVVAYFSRWLEVEQIPAEAITGEQVRRFFDSVGRRRVVRAGEQAALGRFLDFLRQRDIIDPPPEPEQATPVQQTIRAFAAYLRQERAPSERTLIKYCPFVEQFLSECFGQEPLKETDVGSVHFSGPLKGER